MARTTTPLSDSQIKKKKPEVKEFSLADGGGLMLRVKPNGSKLWIFNYSRPYTKKRANIGFGKYPDVTLAAAKKKAEAARKLLADNIDPKTHRIEQDQNSKQALENTFGILAAKWYVLKKQQVKAETADKAWQTMNKHVLPTLENIPVHVIKPKLVIDILNPIASKAELQGSM
jgi:hypothetical protein